jgi:hypothetical protein
MEQHKKGVIKLKKQPTQVQPKINPKSNGVVVKQNIPMNDSEFDFGNSLAQLQGSLGIEKNKSTPTKFNFGNNEWSNKMDFSGKKMSK